MKLGNLDIGDKLILAPLAEITDKPFRDIARKFGAGLTFTQMISARGVVKSEFKTLRKVAFARSELPIGIQILGCEPDCIGESVKEIIKYKPSVIDLNAGCPVKKVTKLGFGVALLANPTKLGKIVAAMKKNANGIPVSVKLRLGFDKNNILETTKIIQEEGADFICVHPKLGIHSSAEKPDWEWIGEVKSKLNIPVIGNGFIFTAEDAIKMKQETGCDSVMVSRGAIGNPFIFERYNKLLNGFNAEHPGLDLIYTTVREHVEKIIIEYGKNSLGLHNAKKHIIWYFKYQNGIDWLIQKILNAKSCEKLMSIMEEHVKNIKENKYEQLDVEEIKRKFNDRILFWLVN